MKQQQLPKPSQGDRFRECEYHNDKLFSDRVIVFEKIVGPDFVFKIEGDKGKWLHIVQTDWKPEYRYEPSKKQIIRVTIEKLS